VDEPAPTRAYHDRTAHDDARTNSSRSASLDIRPITERRGWHALVRIGDEELALALDAVREIALPPRVTRMPGAPPCVIGLAAWRERLLPVCAPHDLLGLKPLRQSAETRALVLGDRDTFCVLVDAVLGVQRLSALQFDGIVALRCAPITSGWTSDPSQPNAARHALLDPHRLLSLLERELLPAAAQAS
jgi:chemotaxis signal transduction protein